MKKVLKIIGAILLSLGVIAFIVCLCVIPNEMQLFFDKVVEFANAPITICGISITLGGVFGYFLARFIINNSSYGKKNLNELNDKIIAIGKVTKENYDEAKELIANFGKENNDKFNEIDKELNTLNKAVLLIPNKKVQEALKNGEEQDN